MGTLGVIPARGDSKDMPRKSIRELGGKPLTTWTIKDAAKGHWLGRRYRLARNRTVLTLVALTI